MDEDDLEAVASLLEDEYARSILRHASEEPLSATELIDRYDGSKATTYRRIDRLQAYNLLETYQEYDPDGHHHKVYAAALDEVRVTLEDGEFDLRIERTSDPADQMTDLFNELK